MPRSFMSGAFLFLGIEFIIKISNQNISIVDKLYNYIYKGVYLIYAK